MRVVDRPRPSISKPGKCTRRKVYNNVVYIKIIIDGFIEALFAWIKFYVTPHAVMSIPSPPAPPLYIMTACENAIAHGLHSPSIAFIVSIYGYLKKIFDGCESG